MLTRGATCPHAASYCWHVLSNATAIPPTLPTCHAMWERSPGAFAAMRAFTVEKLPAFLSWGTPPQGTCRAAFPSIQDKAKSKHLIEFRTWLCGLLKGSSPQKAPEWVDAGPQAQLEV